jgi:hypothetical protein
VQPEDTISIQQKHLIRKRKKIKKVMKARKVKAIIGSPPIIDKLYWGGVGYVVTSAEFVELLGQFIGSWSS